MFCYKKNEGEFGWHSLQRGVNISILEGKEEDLKKMKIEREDKVGFLIGSSLKRKRERWKKR